MVGSLPYFYLVAICILLLLLRKALPKKYKSIPIVFLCATLSFFSGFRYKVGQDYENYVFWFRELSVSSYDISVEPGHYLIVKFCNLIHADFQLMFLIYSTLTIIFIALFIEKNSFYPEISWIIFICIGPFFISTFNGVRQWLSVAIFAYSLTWARKDNFTKYLLLNLFAATFHYSSLLCIPVYLILRIKNMTLLKTFIMFLIILSLSAIGVVGQVLTGFGAGGLSTSENMVTMDITYYVFVALAIVCYFFFFLCKDKQHKEGYEYIFKNMNILSGLMVLCALIISNISNVVFIRLNTYFFVGYIILIPYMISYFSKSRFVISPIVIAFSLTYYLLIVTSNNTITPYVFNFRLFQ